MGYKRLLVYGLNAELYEYEKDFRHIGGRKKGYEKYPLCESLVVGGEVTLSEQSERLGKRKDSAYRASMAFRRLVLANLGGLTNPLLVTFTYAENITDLGQGYKDFTSCIQSLRYKYGSSFKYIAVPEFQTRGAVHFHALFWGLSVEQFGKVGSYPKNVVDTPFWKYGFVFIKVTDGHEKLSNYLVKYMAKAFTAPELRNKKAFVSSRNCSRPFSVGGIDSIGIILSDYLGEDIAPYEQKVYQTSYLGECKKSLFYHNTNI